jgi:hypothetical protein
VSAGQLPTPVQPVARSPQPPAPAPTGNAKAPDAKCTPPFTIDSAGHKHAKPQCL